MAQREIWNGRRISEFDYMSVEFIYPDTREQKIENKPKDHYRPVGKH